MYNETGGLVNSTARTLMRIRILAQVFGGLLLGAFFVVCFAPLPGSFWGNTFFGIPYQDAVALVPLAAAGCPAALAAFLILRNPTNHQRSPFRLGVGIGSLAFVFYFLFHVSAYATVNGISESGAFASALALFGGIFFLPVCCLVSTATEFAVRRYAEP